MVSYSTQNYSSLKKSTWAHIIIVDQTWSNVFKNLYYLVRVVTIIHKNNPLFPTAHNLLIRVPTHFKRTDLFDHIDALKSRLVFSPSIHVPTLPF